MEVMSLRLNDWIFEELNLKIAISNSALFLTYGDVEILDLLVFLSDLSWESLKVLLMLDFALSVGLFHIFELVFCNMVLNLCDC